MIRAFHVTKRYGSITALRDVNLQIRPGEFVFLTGASGAGKTTLLRMLYRAELPTSGQLIVDGRNVASLRRREVPKFRRRIGLVFQDARLIEDRSALENIAFVGRVLGLPRAESRRRGTELLKLTGMGHRAELYPSQLSAGEQQRVGIARAVASRPDLVIADEPTGNLDPALSLEIMQLFERFNKVGVTMLIATHDLELLDRLDHRRLRLDAGKIA